MSDFIKPSIDVALAQTDSKAIDAIARDEEEITLATAIKEYEPLRAFEYLPVSYLESYRLKRYEVKKMIDQLSLRIIRTCSAVPMLCTGPACPVKHLCTIREVRDPAVELTFPIGSACPVEASLIEYWRLDYYRTLRIDQQDKVERDRIEELLELDLTMWFISGVVAAKGHTIESAVGATNTGTPLYKTELNPLLEAKDKAAKRRDKILDELIATREAKERSTLRRAKAQLLDNKKSDWFAILQDKAKISGIEIAQSPVALGTTEIKRLEAPEDGSS